MDNFLLLLKKQNQTKTKQNTPTLAGLQYTLRGKRVLALNFALHRRKKTSLLHVCPGGERRDTGQGISRALP